MLAEIEAGHVEVVITKDLSRLGCNSSLTGLYINYTFPQYGVRYIVINDHFDTIDPTAPTATWQASRTGSMSGTPKIPAAKSVPSTRQRGSAGERLTTNVPYGYKRDSDDPKKWVIDEEAAQVVKRIFALCMEGKGPSQIAALLEKEKVLNPTAYKQRRAEKHRIRPRRTSIAGTKAPLLTSSNTWSTQAVRSISRPTPTPSGIRNSGKIQWRIARFSITPTRQSSLWKSLIRCRRSGSSGTAERRRERAICSPVWCSCNDCKQKLYYSTTSYFEKRQDFFICSTHRVNKDKCSGHYIRAVVLEQIVWKHIQESYRCHSL